MSVKSCQIKSVTHENCALPAHDGDDHVLSENYSFKLNGPLSARCNKWNSKLFNDSKDQHMYQCVKKKDHSDVCVAIDQCGTQFFDLDFVEPTQCNERYRNDKYYCILPKGHEGPYHASRRHSWIDGVLNNRCTYEFLPLSRSLRCVRSEHFHTVHEYVSSNGKYFKSQDINIDITVNKDKSMDKNKIWTPIEVIARYNNGERDFSGLEIYDEPGMPENSFQKVSFTDVSFANSFIVGSFTSANLRYCNFRNANIKTCCFDNVNLHSCDFSGAAMDGVTFNNANIQMCSIDLEHIERASMSVLTPVTLAGPNPPMKMPGGYVPWKIPVYSMVSCGINTLGKTNQCKLPKNHQGCFHVDGSVSWWISNNEVAYSYTRCAYEHGNLGRCVAANGHATGHRYVDINGHFHSDDEEVIKTDSAELLGNFDVKLLSAQDQVLHDLYRFLCGLSLETHSVKTQREVVELLRRAGKVLGDNK